MKYSKHEHRTDHRHDISSRYRLKFHGFGLGTITLLVTWLVSHTLMAVGIESMAIRYGVALLVGYAAYLAMLRVWAGRLTQSRQSRIVDAVDAVDLGTELLFEAGHAARAGMSAAPNVSSGGGGSFGGGGASGDFMSDALGGALEGAGSAVADSDEGAVVVIPIVAVFLIVVVFFLGLGSIVFLYFGSEALLSAAVEIAFSYTASNAAVNIARQGWLTSVFQITWKPLLGAVLCAVALGFLMDTFLPNATSLFEAMREIQRYFAG